MKKIHFLLVLVFMLTVSNATYGQSLKDILNSSGVKDVVSTVTGKQALTATDLQATWTYVKPACELVSSNLLKGAGGNIISAQIEKKIDELCTKAGISKEKFGYTFNADSTFSNTLGKGTPLNGTYTLDPETQIVTLQYGKAKLTSIEAKVSRSGDNINLLFNANKLMDLITLVSNISENSTLKTINQLAKQYDGLMLGFELKK